VSEGAEKIAYPEILGQLDLPGIMNPESKVSLVSTDLEKLFCCCQKVATTPATASSVRNRSAWSTYEAYRHNS